MKDLLRTTLILGQPPGVTRLSFLLDRIVNQFFCVVIMWRFHVFNPQHIASGFVSIKTITELLDSIDFSDQFELVVGGDSAGSKIPV